MGAISCSNANQQQFPPSVVVHFPALLSPAASAATTASRAAFGQYIITQQKSGSCHKSTLQYCRSINGFS